MHPGLAQTDISKIEPNPASLQPVQIPSHEALLNGFVYVAAGKGPHPVVLLLHGLPGYERNLDLAQELRRAGWDVLYFDYRGSWGSPGTFSLSHCLEDAAAAIAYLRRPAIAKDLRADSSRIVLVGHSMGGFVAVEAVSEDSEIAAVALISAVDLGGLVPQNLPQDTNRLVKALSEGYASQGLAPLSGCTPEVLALETIANARRWSFVTKAGALSSKPLLIVTSDDGFASGSDALAAALRTAGNRQTDTLHLSTDHSYSDKRIALSKAVLHWLSRRDVTNNKLTSNSPEDDELTTQSSIHR
jgi:pimeloyl-ACP methyl ester carboxylesterase